MTKAQHEFQKLTDQKEFGTQNAHAERLNAIHPAALLQGRMKKKCSEFEAKFNFDDFDLVSSKFRMIKLLLNAYHGKFLFFILLY